jgi:hypothetical protein
MPVQTVLITDTCSQVINTPGVLITSIDGRLKGNQISFMNFTYDEYKMRRKVEVLQYVPKNTNTTRTKYSYITKNNYYSQAKLKNFINQASSECLENPSTSSCSGVIGSNMIYKLNPNVPYFSSI